MHLIGSTRFILRVAVESCERIVQTAADEVGETIAFLEDMPLYLLRSRG